MCEEAFSDAKSPIIFDEFIAGRPTPKGSFTAMRTKTNRIWLKPVSSDALSAWFACLRSAVPAKTRQNRGKNSSPVSISAVFYFSRPKSHCTKKGILQSSETWVNRRPDLDKLLRALLDALTGVLWDDDAHVVEISANKRWCSHWQQEGCYLTVTEKSESEKTI